MKRSALALVVLAGLTGSATAGDIYAPAPSLPPLPPPSPAFSWKGFYSGLYGGFLSSPIAAWQAGMTLGYNFTPGERFLIGVEGQVGGAFLGPAAVQVDANIRFGGTLGAEDRVLIYVEGGAGFLGGLGPTWNAGGGVEVAVTDGFSLFGEAKAYAPFAGGVGVQAQFGFNWHFGPFR